MESGSSNSSSRAVAISPPLTTASCSIAKAKVVRLTANCGIAKANDKYKLDTTSITSNS